MEKTLRQEEMGGGFKGECVWYVYECIFCIAGEDHIQSSYRYHV